MATINVREESEFISTITFGESNERLLYSSTSKIVILDSNENLVSICISDIDYLIKALQKAKELWT